MPTVEDTIVWWDACSAGENDSVKRYCHQKAFDVNRTLLWTEEEDTELVQTQLNRPRGWFRERHTYKFKYGKGCHVISSLVHIERDAVQEKCYLYSTSGLRRTGLHEAASAGHLETSSILLDFGADSMLKDSSGKIALHYCAEQAYFSIAEILVGKGSKNQLGSVDLQLRTPLHAALYALQRQRRRVTGSASQNNLERIIDLLLPFSNLQLADSFGMTCAKLEISVRGDLFSACFKGDFGRMKRLVQEHPSGVNTTMDILKRTALHEACEQNRCNIVEYLLAKGANPLLQDCSGQTPLHCCARRGYAHCTRVLLRGCLHSQTENPSQQLCALQDHCGRTSLLKAILCGNVDVALILIKYSSAVLVSSDSNGIFPLYAAAAMGLVGVSAALIKACDKQSLTKALNNDGHEAVQETHPSYRLVPSLHQWKKAQRRKGSNPASWPIWADHLSTDAPQRLLSPLHAAIRGAHLEVVGLLLDARADPTACDLTISDVEIIEHGQQPQSKGYVEWRRSPLELAASLGQVESMKSLMSIGEVFNQSDNNSLKVMLLRSCLDVKLETVKLLLEKRADPNVPTRAKWYTFPSVGVRQWTPLYVAFGFHKKRTCLNRIEAQLCPELADVLIKYGGNLEWRDESGWTYLHHAVSLSCLDTVLFLLQSGSANATYFESCMQPAPPPLMSLLFDSISTQYQRTAVSERVPYDSLLGGYLSDRHVLQAHLHRQQNSILEVLVRANESLMKTLDPSSGMSYLQLALFHGFWGAAREMLHFHASVASLNGCSVLSYAARARQPKLLRQLAQLCPLARATEKEWRPALYLAARLGNTPALQVLCDSIRRTPPDSSIAGRNLWDLVRQPLIYAVGRPSVGAVEVLMKLVVDDQAIRDFDVLVNVVRGGSCAVLHRISNSDTVEWQSHCLNHLEGDKHVHLLSKAVDYGHQEIAVLLLEQIALRKIKVDQPDVLHCACRSSMPKFVRRFLEHSMVEVSQKDEFGLCARDYARLFGQSEVLTLLEVDVEISANSESEPLFGVLKNLMNAHANNSPSNEHNSLNALRKMISQEETLLRHLVIESSRAQIHGQADSYAALFNLNRSLFSDCFQHPAAAAKWGLRQHLRAMFAAGANADEFWQGSTALFWAARTGSLSTLELLISSGANVNLGYRIESLDEPALTGSIPSSPILEAACRHHGGIVLRLLQAGAHPGTLGSVKQFGNCTISSTLLHLATQFRHEKDSRTVISLLLTSEDADINVTDATGLTPLSWACASGRVSLVLWMILNGAEVELPGCHSILSSLQFLPSVRHRDALQVSMRGLKLCILQCEESGCTGCSITDHRGRCMACGESWTKHSTVPTLQQ